MIPHRRVIVAFIVLTAVGAILGIIPPLLVRAIIDRAIPRRREGLLAALVAAAVVVFVVRAFINGLATWVSARIGTAVVYDLRRSLYQKFLAMPMSFFASAGVGATFSRINNDVMAAQQLVTGNLSSVVSDSIVIFVTTVAMLVISVPITLLTFAFLPIIWFAATRIRSRVTALSHNQLSAMSGLGAFITDRLNASAMVTVKLFGATDDLTQFDTLASSVRDVSASLLFIVGLFSVAIGAVAGAMTFGVFGYGAELAMRGHLSLGAIIALALFAQQLYPQVVDLISARLNAIGGLVSFQRVFEILDLADERDGTATVKGSADRDRTEAIDGGLLEFARVGLIYPTNAPADGDSSERRPALRDISFAATRGQTIALVGPTGAGKSSVLGLIARLYDPTEGEVSLDRRNVMQIPRSSVRQKVGYVSQHPHLFHQTILQNLLYARPDATFDEVRNACAMAEIDAFITRLPSGYETPVGEFGHLLSGGELQRIALARVLLKDAPIVLLDEATAHLDPETESLVQAAVARVLQDRIAVVAAHKLGTVELATEILVLKDGMVVERGRHDDLIAHGGTYAAFQVALRRNSGPD